MLKWISEGLLVFVALPLFAFQTYEMIQGFVSFLADSSQWINFK